MPDFLLNDPIVLLLCAVQCLSCGLAYATYALKVRDLGRALVWWSGCLGLTGLALLSIWGGFGAIRPWQAVHWSDVFAYASGLAWWFGFAHFYNAEARWRWELRGLGLAGLPIFISALLGLPETGLEVSLTNMLQALQGLWIFTAVVLRARRDLPPWVLALCSLSMIVLASVTAAPQLSHFGLLTQPADVDIVLRNYREMGLALFLAVNLFSFVVPALISGRLIQQLKDLSARDLLTGVLNRRGLKEALDRAWERWQHLHEPFALVMVDIDYFKHINDSLGHAAGDKVLTGFARLISAQKRESDFLFRHGGEEFLVLVSGANAAHAAELAERLRRVVEASRWDHFDAGFRLTASFGVASVAPDETDVEAVLRRADQALYKAKDEGRNIAVSSDGGTLAIIGPPRAATPVNDG